MRYAKEQTYYQYIFLSLNNSYTKLIPLRVGIIIKSPSSALGLAKGLRRPLKASFYYPQIIKDSSELLNNLLDYQYSSLKYIFPGLLLIRLSYYSARLLYTIANLQTFQQQKQLRILAIALTIAMGVQTTRSVRTRIQRPWARVSKYLRSGI